MTEHIEILYVDDEPDLLMIGKLFLERNEGIKVSTHESAISALALIQTQSFDAIISDYQMPQMDGIEFLRTVRSSDNNIPFIIFTGKGREEVVIQALNEGADFYLQKGGDPKAQYTELIHKIRQAVKQRRLEINISDHERREADILNFLPDATFAINTEGVVIAWNRAMEQMTGVQASDMLGKGNFEYALPFYHDRRPLLINKIFEDDSDFTALYPIIKTENGQFSSEITISHFNEGNGAILWFTASPLYNNEGKIVGAIESIRDITESRRAVNELHQNHEQLQVAYEEIHASDQELRSNVEKLTIQTQKLEEREQQLQAMASNIPGVVYRFVVNPDRTTGFEYISSRSADILGIENNPATFSEEVTHNIVPEERERFLISMQQAIETKTAWEFETRYIKPSREEVWLKAVSSPVFENGRYVFDGIIFDVTDRKRNEEILQKKNEDLDNQNRLINTILDTVPIGIFMVEAPTGKPLISNPAAIRILGRGILPNATEENLSEVYEAMKLGTGQKYPTSEMPIVQGMYGKSTHIDDMEVIHPDGTRILLEVFGNPVIDAQGHVIASIVSFLDITERK